MVLNILFDIPVAVLAVNVMLRLVKGVVNAQKRIGEPVAGIERIGTRRTAAVAEVVVAVEGTEEIGRASCRERVLMPV